MTRFFLGVAVVLAVLLWPVFAPAEEAAQELQGVAGPAAKFYGYITPVITISKGDSLTFTNLDIEMHNIVQDVNEDGKGGPKKVKWCKRNKGHNHGDDCPLFWSKLIGFQSSTKVKGLQRTKPGETYSFFCTLHHSMKGKLVVLP
jgi:plastocyanin